MSNQSFSDLPSQQRRERIAAVLSSSSRLTVGPVMTDAIIERRTVYLA